MKRLPDDPSFKSIDVTSDYPVISSTASSGRTLKRSKSGQRWQFKLKWVMLTPQQVRKVRGFLASVGQGLGAFEVVLPLESQALTDFSGEGVVRQATSAGQNAVQLSGLPFNRPILETGSYLKFADHSKVYMVTEDVESDGQGHAQLQLFPSLVNNVTAAESVVMKEVPFTVEMEDDPLEWSIKTGPFYEMELDVSEKLS